MRDSQLLILDEPTAALDAGAEYEVFLRLSELTKGPDGRADLALILDGADGGHDCGAEGWGASGQGTHEALVERGGLYAELFQLQAAGYR